MRRQKAESRRQKNQRWVLCLLPSALLAATLSSAPQRPDPIHWSLEPERRTASLRPGGKLTLELKARIEDGWHLYAMEQAPGGPLATHIRVPQGQWFELAGDIDEPPPRVQFDPYFNLDTQFFEEEVIFEVPLRAAKKASAGKYPAKVAVTFQTCNARMCLPPRTVTLAIDLNIRRVGPRP